MGSGHGHPAAKSDVRPAPAGAPVQAAATRGWEQRLEAGLHLAAVPTPVRRDLGAALGAAGVEAEFFLELLASLTKPRLRSHADGEVLLRRLEDFGHRLMRVAARLELAAQSYLTALETAHPNLRADSEHADAWWTAPTHNALTSEPIELAFRRYGFAYRHVVVVHLASNVEAITEQMQLTLHALHTLPPAGIVPLSALHHGLYELASALQGYLVAHHIGDLSADTPGLLSGITRLRALTQREDTTLQADIAWARAQYAFVQGIGAPGPQRHTGIEAALREWRDTIAALEHLQSTIIGQHE